MYRVDKILSISGMSRSDARRYIAAGRVSVQGRIVRDPGVKANAEDVCLDGQPVQVKEKVYLMMNKPAGVVTSTEDPRWPTVLSLLPKTYARRKIGPIGRLDRDVTGLVILCDDGDLVHRIIAPQHRIDKVYRAECAGELTEADVRAFSEGLDLKEFVCRPAKLEILGVGKTRSTALVTLTEGKFHQVKRMFAAVGHPIEKLSRVSIGPVTLDPALEEGQARELTEEETAALRAAAYGSDE